ncbi:MAG: endonuclease [Muribaculaceae bacterium]|nr:endonuclease [Muribaculaceae bacterium]
MAWPGPAMQPAAAGASALAAALASAHRPPTLPERPAVAEWWGHNTDTLYIVPSSWWAETPRDVYNMLTAPHALVEAITYCVPGTVTDVTAHDEGWEVGLGEISSVATNMWRPSPDRRGDIARRYMYMALVYPRELWQGRAVMMFTDGGWPLLTPYAKALLLEWHRNDPVDRRELAENRVLAASQGNVNPFVEWPEVAEYLWGSHAGEEWTFPGDDPGPETLVPLKARYSKLADGRLWLHSPHVPQGAAWTLDGQPCESPVDLAGMATGRHELNFVTPETAGSMIFYLEP